MRFTDCSCDCSLRPLNLKRISHFFIFIFLVHCWNHSNKLTGCATCWICLIDFMVSFTQPSNYNFSCKQKFREKSFQVKLLWVRVLYLRCHVLTSCHIITFLFALRSISQFKWWQPDACIFKLTTFLSTNARILSLGCKPHNLLPGVKYRVQNLETTADWVLTFRDAKSLSLSCGLNIRTLKKFTR